MSSAFASGFVVRKDRPKDGPKFQYYVLQEELKKRRIATRQLALALELSANVVAGRAGDFPLEKVDQCVELINNWTGPTGSPGWGKTATAMKPITRELLLV